ncbi:MAG: prepilin-type N-terminal cleavage/methylation domain-containing protein [Oscillospiraceae bacterium]|nr:prepilin-type N-terminal cleavage/methylation domain-containing protein [Oscillospiraceae bacterium]
MKFLHRLKSNKGVTLIELLVGIALLALLMSSVGFIIVPLFRVSHDVSDLAELNTLLDNISRVVVRDLSAATSSPTGAAPAPLICNNCSNPDPCGCGTPDPVCSACVSSPCTCPGGAAINIGLVTYTTAPCACTTCGGGDPTCLDCLGIINCSICSGGAGTCSVLYRQSGGPASPRVPVLAKSFLKAKSVLFTWNPEPTPDGSEAYRLTFTITDDTRNSNVMTLRSYVVRPLILNTH